MKEQDAAHSLQKERIEDDAITYIHTCARQFADKTSYIAGAKAEYNRFFEAKKEMETLIESLRDELTSLRSELQQAKHDNECLKEFLQKEQTVNSDKDYTVIKNNELNRLTTKLNQLTSELHQERELRKELVEGLESVIRLKALIEYPQNTKEKHIGEAMAISGMLAKAESLIKKAKLNN